MAALRTQLSDNGPSAGLVAPNMSAVSSSSTRSVSHGRRSQSLSEGHHSPATPAASAGHGAFPPASADSRSGDGAQPMGQEGAAAGSGSGSGLARRNNTVSTASSSRLVRLERNRARLALQGVGLSEEDQEFYVPPSPVNGGPYAVWSDVGHGDSSIPTKTAAATAAVNAQAAWSRIQEEDTPLPDQPSRNTVQAGPNSQVSSSANPEPKRSSFVVVRGGKGDAALTERRARERGVSAPGGTESTLYPAPIGSSLSTSPQQQPLISSPGQTPEDQPLRHKNSLKPFLEQELAQQGGDEVQEDWEKGLLAERRSGAGGVGLDAGGAQQSLRTPPLPGGAFASQLSSPCRAVDSTSPRFGQPQRGQTIDPRLQPPTATPSPAVSSFSEAGEEPLRRHQSLKAFRTPRYREASIEQTLSTSPGSSPWPETAGGPADEFYGGQHARQSSHLSVASANSAGGFASRTRSGTGPAPLALQHSNSLGHSSSSTFAESLGPVRLSHSNSLSAAYPSSSGSGSTTLHHSNSLGSRSDSGMSTGGGEGRSRVLSPVVSSFGGAKSPWSLTEEESQQLGLNNAPFGSSEAAGVSRDSSGSSRSARAERAQKADTLAQAAPEGINQAAYAAEVRRLEEALATMQMGGLVAPASFSQFDRNTPSPGGGSGARRLAPLMTSTEALNLYGLGGRHGPASAAAFVPPIGHSHTHFAPHTLDGISEYSSTASSSPPMPQQQHFQSQAAFVPSLPCGGVNGLAPAFDPSAGRNNLTAVPGSVNAAEWARQKEYLLGGGPAVANQHGGGPFPPQGPPLPPTADPQVATLQQIQMQQQQQQIASLQSQMAQALSAMDAMRAQGAVLPANFDLANATRLSNAVNAVAQQQQQQQQQQQAVPETPVDVSALAQTKGYNPTMFDLNPPNARFFVIKSYTEEDVHKSLKYEIWASTDLGNKRLDRAFRESADKGPIYLFFSVNASGHFAGVAQMQTPVDYSMSSNVWASDKWKGVLKVRWIYIKDVPLAALRHIRLSNTPENKPVTSSRDTQEVPYEAGLEVLRIIANYQSRTSLLQDYAWYEAQFRRNQQFAPAGAGVDAQVQPGDPVLPQPAPHYANANSSSPGPPVDGQQRAPRQQQQQQQQQQQSSGGGRRFWNRAPPQNGPNRSSPGPPPHIQQHGQFVPYPQQFPPGPPLPQTVSPPSHFYSAFPQQEHPSMPPGHY